MATKIHTSSGWLYDPVFPHVEDWPIYKLAENQEEFIELLKQDSMRIIHDLTQSNPAKLEDELAKTLYLERVRMKQTPWKADKPDEGAFWSGIKKKMVRVDAENPEKSAEEYEEIMKTIVDRYAWEIAGKFDYNAYSFAKEFVSIGFSWLLNASQGKGLSRLWSTKHNLHEKIKLEGEINQIRSLARKGTIVMVPTHFSNIDSILIGWAIQSIGLPPFVYGAGLNLFGIGILAYFMNRLGAYKVDRRKKNLPYLETLKTYSTLALTHGCNSLFFPGGTRSRSGALESKLKLGLLGTALEAQRRNFMHDPENGKKIYVVPVVFGYNFVLEAQGLIDEYLKRSGQEHYYRENDDFATPYKLGMFLLKFMTVSSEISISFGRAMDLFGNEVDEEGRSIGKDGREVDIKKYFYSNGEITEDRQRDAEYTIMLGDEIVKRFHEENIVFSSHLVAFAAFEIIKKRYKKLDIYGLLRLPEEDELISYEEFAKVIGKLKGVLIDLKNAGKVKLHDNVENGSVDSIIEVGVANSGVYHAKRPLFHDKQKNHIQSEDFNLLFYYHNRLEGYGLAKHV